MSEKEVNAIAQGRVWTGRQAKENGLVDELGGLNLALAISKEKAGLPEDAEVEIVTFPKRKLFLDLDWTAMFSSSPDLKSIIKELKEENIFKDDRILLLMPYTIDIK